MFVSKHTEKGQTLVPAIGIALAISLLVSGIGVIIIKDKKDFYIKKSREDIYFASKAMEKKALQHFLANTTIALQDKINEMVGAGQGTNLLMSDSEASSFIANLPPLSSESLNNSGTLPTGYDSIPNKIKMLSVFCDDLNNNGVCESGEPPSTFLGRVEMGPRDSYQYRYVITSYGFIGDSLTTAKFRRKIVTYGDMALNVAPKSLAEYALLANDTSNAMFWWGDTVQGPIHTNGTFIFYGDPSNGGDSTKFLSKASSTGTSIKWVWPGGNKTETLPVENENPSYSVGTSVKVKPTFSQGLKRGQAKVDLPQNSMSQERVAMGLSDEYVYTTTPMTNSEKRMALGLPAGSSAPPTDIYVPSSGGSLTGGIFVQGNVEDMVMSVDASNNQVYDIKTSSGSKRKRITIDKTNNTTKIETLDYTTGNVTATSNLNGTPKGTIHVEGSINSMGGQSRPTSTPNDPATAAPAIQEKNALTVSASGNVFISRDIKYQKDPRGSDGQFNTSDDNLNTENMLGIFSGTGKVTIKSNAPKDINIHGIIMAGKTGTGTFNVEGYNTRPASECGKIHLLGGTLFDKLSATETTNGKGYGTNYVYDIRTSQGMSPPYFPSGKTEQQQPSMTIFGTTEKDV